MIKKVLDNSVISVAFALFLVLYGLALSRVELNSSIHRLFENNMFRVVILSVFMLIIPNVYAESRNMKIDLKPHIVILITLIFVVTLSWLNEMDMREYYIKNKDKK
jgi:hypothetical protein